MMRSIGSTRSLAIQLSIPLCLILPAQLWAHAGSAALLSELSLEQLLEIPITSVSRRSESLAGAAASVFVITADDIHRSGATTLPQILQLAPNLQVARRNNTEYAISARGFNNNIGNKLLVLIDGRTVYTSLFSGVFWEMQDVLPEDIERIEVISGPGATLWGANAVNGVINVITKNSSDTTGTLLSADSGSDEYGGSARIGGTFANHGSWRVYGKARDWENTRLASGAAVKDSWKRQQIGFRADWADNRDHFTLQGDALTGRSQHRGIVNGIELTPLEVEENNLTAQWTRRMSSGSTFALQAYWIQNQREEVFLFSPRSEVFDISFNQHLPLGNHNLVWGGGIRRGSDEVEAGLFTVFLPDDRTLRWENIFMQDDIQLSETLQLTLGLKFEWNDYTGREYLPTARLSWNFADQHTIWGGVSRAVRAPSRFDRDIFLPKQPPFIVAGGPEFESEVAVVTEIGYRGQPSERMNFALTFFHHDWDGLRSGTPLPLPITYANDINGEAYGVEAWANVEMTPSWRLQAGMTTLEKDLRFRAGGGDTVGVENETLHNDPDYQLKLRSSFDLGNTMHVDLQLRHIAELAIESVPAYTELDLWWAWFPREDLEISLTGRNLLDSAHPEIGDVRFRSEFSRSFLIGMKWTP